jgi:hypothetical protein
MLTPSNWKAFGAGWLLWSLGVAVPGSVQGQPTSPHAAPPRVVVEVEEDVYTVTPANNGAGPMWCSGSTTLVRLGDRVFASGLETLPDARPLNNCRWLLFERTPDGWQQVQADPTGRTREPSPLAVFPDGQLFLSANPTRVEDPTVYSGPSRPELIRFLAKEAGAGFEILPPKWVGTPPFTEHSYRSFAADGPRHELILFQNVGYTHAEWTFRDAAGNWRAQGQLTWPWGAEYDRPQPIRICYPNVALQDRAVYFCGVSDIIEPYRAWRDYKRERTGREWDYDFRRLFFSWSPDVTTGEFKDWIEIASRDQTAGWISPGDLWVAPDQTVHLVWTERAIDERLRNRFFPNERQSHQLNYARIRHGQILHRDTLAQADEGVSGEIPAAPRFHALPDGRLLLIYHVRGSDPQGRSLSENRLMELLPEGVGPPPYVRVPLRHPMHTYFTATVRAGSAPSQFIDLLGHGTAANDTLRYARIRVLGAAKSRPAVEGGRIGFSQGQGEVGREIDRSLAGSR